MRGGASDRVLQLGCRAKHPDRAPGEVDVDPHVSGNGQRPEQLPSVRLGGQLLAPDPVLERERSEAVYGPALLIDTDDRFE